MFTKSFQAANSVNASVTPGVIHALCNAYEDADAAKAVYPTYACAEHTVGVFTHRATFSLTVPGAWGKCAADSQSRWRQSSS